MFPSWPPSCSFFENKKQICSFRFLFFWLLSFLIHEGEKGDGSVCALLSFHFRDVWNFFPCRFLVPLFPYADGLDLVGFLACHCTALPFFAFWLLCSHTETEQNADSMEEMARERVFSIYIYI
jgi:hypothetical protein